MSSFIDDLEKSTQTISGNLRNYFANKDAEDRKRAYYANIDKIMAEKPVVGYKQELDTNPAAVNQLAPQPTYRQVPVYGKPKSQLEAYLQSAVDSKGNVPPEALQTIQLLQLQEAANDPGLKSFDSENDVYDKHGKLVHKGVPKIPQHNTVEIDTSDPVVTKDGYRYKYVVDSDPVTHKPIPGAQKRLIPLNAVSAAGGALGGPGFDVLSKDEQNVWYENYRLKEKLPPMATRDKEGRTAFTKGYAQYLLSNGITPTQGAIAKLNMDALKGSLNLQQKSLNAIGGFTNNLTQQIDKVEKMFKDKVVQRIGTRALDVPMRLWKTQFAGSGAEKVLESYLVEISNEIGKISTGSQASISELSISAQERWAKIHDPNLSMNEIMKILNATKEQANIRENSVKSEVGKIQSEMEGLGIGEKPTGKSIKTKSGKTYTVEEVQ